MKSLLGRGIESQRAEPIVKDYVARNTFILALDGDIDFQPEAVLHLVDLMRRDQKVAAACGRIHPTGSGKYSVIKSFSEGMIHPSEYSKTQINTYLCRILCYGIRHILLFNQD